MCCCFHRAFDSFQNSLTLCYTLKEDFSRPIETSQAQVREPMGIDRKGGRGANLSQATQTNKPGNNKLTKLGDAIAISKSETINHCTMQKLRTGLKVVNFDKLFLHQFSTKNHQTLRAAVKTSKKSKNN